MIDITGRRPIAGTSPHVVEEDEGVVRVWGQINTQNAAIAAAELIEALRSRRHATVVDLTQVVLEDCAGVRRLREAITSVAAAGLPLSIRTADPVARASFDVSRVA